MRITIDGGHNILHVVNIPLCDTKYTKFGEGFFDSEALEGSDTLEDIIRERFESFSIHENGRTEFSEWKKKNEDEAWYDLREGEDGGIYIVAGDSEGIKFVSMVDFLQLDYEGHEYNTTVATEMAAFLKERYRVISVSTTESFFSDGKDPASSTTLVCVQINPSGYDGLMAVYYIPYEL